MALTSDSLHTKGHDENWDMPQSPGADYGLTDDFDPAKYDFYNPHAYSSRVATSGSLTEEYSPVVSNHHVEERNPTDNRDGSPEQLSPIEELDDDVRSLHPPWRSAESAPPNSFGEEAQSSVLKKTAASSEHTSLKDNTPGPSLLELRTDLLFSRQHLETILADRILATKFITFLRKHRPDSTSILTYYLAAVNALKALRYAESAIDGLQAVPGHSFTDDISSTTMSWVVEDKIAQTLSVLVQKDLPAFIAYTYAETLDLTLMKRMNGRQDPTTLAASDGIAESFFLSDPASHDNPIVFTSEGFHYLTGYCRSDILGRNCRILGGSYTNLCGRKRLKSSLDAEREHYEVLLNYRRDGSAFVNLVICIPLRDKANRVRYWLGAQLDITGPVDDYMVSTSLRQTVKREENESTSILNSDVIGNQSLVKDFDGLTKVFTTQELENLAALKKHDGTSSDSSSPILPQFSTGGITPALGFYQNYLLARPYPSLRVLFTSPTLQFSGILQQPLLDSIGGSRRVRQDLAHALEVGRKVTAKVQWLSRSSSPSNCWLHCTPLLGVADSIGVWIIILVDVSSGNDNPNDSTRAPHPRTGGHDVDQSAADASLWLAMRKHKVPSQASIATRNTKDRNVQDKKDGVQVARSGTEGIPSQNEPDPLMLKARLDPPNEAILRVSSKVVEANPSALKNEVLKGGRKLSNRGTTQQAFRHDEKSDGKGGRPLSSGSSKASIKSALQPADKVITRSFDERRTGKSAPIKMPGHPPLSSLEDDNQDTLPVRKRTYKSLSPYGIIFDD